MNVNLAQKLKKTPFSMPRFCRVLAAAFCVLLLTVVPALADTVRVNQVVQTLTSSQGRPDLKLNTLVSQDPVKGAAQQSGPTGDVQTGTQKPGQGTDSVLNGVAITGEGTTLGVEIVEEGEVEGTICDCGEIFIAGAAFPKWPFLLLAAVPVVFINDCCDENDSTPTPTPTPNPTPTPTRA